MNEKLDKNRWSINKLGILNYWFYDEEEIEFSDGRLILRGENGAGKSVTMQAFIPLLFDGNRSSERLDSFCAKGKKVEDYVLGYNEFEKEESTSYLYMEFKKKETNNYLTIGIGLHAKKNRPTDFYGFAIKDSRRIGKDILLYKSKDNKIPISKIELKNLIGQGGTVVATSKEYMQLVNDNLFGFETLDEYSEFLKLVIDVRKPKLSKDGYKPSDITKIMSDSLRSLSDEDLRPVSESIENMNKTKEQLEVLKICHKSLSNVLKSYNKYNNSVIFTKANTFLEVNKDYEKILKSKKTNEKNIKELENNLNIQKENLNDNIKEYEMFKIKDEELSKSDIYEKKNQLLKIDENIEKIKSNIEQKEEQLLLKKRTLNFKKDEVCKKDNEKYKLENSLNELLDEMSQLAIELKFNSFTTSKDQILTQTSKQYEYSVLKMEFNNYLEKIKMVLEKLEIQKEKEKEYDRQSQILDELNQNKQKQDKVIDKNRQYFEQVKEEYIEDIYSWQNTNTYLKLQDKTRSNILLKLNSYGDGTTFDDIIQELRFDYDNLKDKLRQEKIKIEAQDKEIQELIKISTVEIDEWKNTREPEPIREKEVIQNRLKLHDENILFKPFYELIDFKSDISQKDKSKVESALLNMSILDALVIDKKDIEKALKIDTNFVDKYIIANPTMLKNDISQMFNVIGNEQSLKCQVDEILRSIVLDKDESLTYIQEDGMYHIGILNGKISNDYNAKFIGKEARKEYKEQQIAKLNLYIQELSNKSEDYLKIIDDLNQNIDILDKEFNLFPKKDDIETADNMLKDSILTMLNIKDSIIKAEQKLAIVQLSFKSAKAITLEISKNMYFSLNLITYKEAINLAGEFSKKILELQNLHNNIINIEEYLSTLNINIDEILEDLNGLNYDLDTATKESNNLFSQKDAIEKLFSSDFSDIEEQITKCREKLASLPLQKDELIKDISIISTKIEYEKREVDLILENINIKRQVYKIAKDVFEKEVLLGYIKMQELVDIQKDERDNDFYIDFANKIINKFSEFATDIHTTEYYLDNLMANFRDNAGELNEYNITRKELFTANAKEYETQQNTEIRKIAATYLRKDLCGFFSGKSLNLNELYIQIENTIVQMDALIEEDDKELFEDILTNTIGSKIRRKIYDAKIWIKNINNLLASIDSKITFSFNWKPKNAETQEQINTKELVDILNCESSLLREEEIKKVSKHFRSKIAKAQQRLDEKGNVKSLHSLMKDALDYREWFEFEFFYIKRGEQKKELTNNAFYKLSGGEKAMAMYIPLFAAVYARLEGANKDALRIIALDEAFAGVDEKNISNMFGILTELKIDYIINSQILWGDYETIPQIAIYHMIKSDEKRTVALTKYLWNGKMLELTR